MNDKNSALHDELIAGLKRMGLAGDGTVKLTPLTGGVASDIFRVDAAGHKPFALKRALAKLRVAADWRAPTERNSFEYAWMKEAGRILPDAVPHLLGHDAEAGMFAMDYLAPESYPVWKAELRDGMVSPDFAEAVGKSLAMIHGATAGRDEIRAQFSTDHIFHPIRLEPYLEATATKHPAVADRLRALSLATLGRKIALVHGDVSPKNILCGPKGPVFLDAECAWYGDPAFDVAFCLNHLLLKCLWTPHAIPKFLDAFDVLSRAYLGAVTWEPAGVIEARIAALLPGLFLARVDGKSPVEYITEDDQRDLVRKTALPLLANPVDSVNTIAEAWRLALQEWNRTASR
jgi:aminoglycoside phosphotransferase (APT) family kinase protein